MTAEIVNLRRARRAKLRAGKEAEAATNRALHGRTRAARDVETLARERAERGLDGHLLQSAQDLQSAKDLTGANDDGDAS